MGVQNQASLLDLLQRGKRKAEALDGVEVVDLTDDDELKANAEANAVRNQKGKFQYNREEEVNEEIKEECGDGKIDLEDPQLIAQQQQMFGQDLAQNTGKNLDTDLDIDLIPCPVCQLDIQRLSLNDREAHVELCLLQPNTHKSIVVPSMKKPKITKEPKESKPKEPKEHKPKPRTKPIPDFKILTFQNNYKVNVDGFQFMDHPDIDKYFLSHYHSDHYIGLGKKWQQGIIYTSKTSANLLKTIMKLQDEQIIGLDFNKPFNLTDLITVTLYDANHCPGGAIFLFEEYDNEREIVKRILHTGDFRVSLDHITRFKNVYLDEIYLDTTYMNPVYTFIPQSHVIRKSSNFITKIVKESIKKNSILNYFQIKSDYLIIIGAYSIGKEKLYIDLAKTINSKILITKEKFKMLSCIENFHDLDIFTIDELDPKVKIQIVPIGKLSDPKFLSKYQTKKIIKIKPTGWSFNTFKTPRNSIKGKEPNEILSLILKPDVESYTQFENQLFKQFNNSSSLNIPYSEHSSFKELCIFGCYLTWGKIIPTVNVSNPGFQEWFDLWKDTKIDSSIIDNYYKLP